jgi:hypothetical protein
MLVKYLLGFTVEGGTLLGVLGCIKDIDPLPEDDDDEGENTTAVDVVGPSSPKNCRVL